MDALMLEGWTPILLIGIASGLIFFYIARKLSKKAVWFVSILLGIAYAGIVIYSKEVVGGWDGIGLFVLASVSLAGIVIGTVYGRVYR